MIGQLTGRLLRKQPPEILIDVQGVGYEVQMPMTCMYDLPEIGENVVLCTHFVVREDAQLLYGFNTQAERTLFRQLIKAQGVGPKLALTIMSGMSASQFVRAVSHDDVSSLIKLPGVGRKTAERLVVEMRDRLANWTSATPATDSFGVDDHDLQPTIAVNDPRQDALSALAALGYKPIQAEKAIKQVATSGMSSEEMIRQALKSMA
ncbi:MAG: Holliday junction branch migration protein RuvA [Idiomarina sp.]